MRDELIAAIENDPDDVESYRVYADWLEANGQPRGQLIQMELLRARLTDGSKIEHLRRRIEPYFYQHRAVFMNGLSGWTDIRYENHYSPLKWRYGFIHDATIGGSYNDDDENPRGRLRQLLRSPSGRFLVNLTITAEPAQALLDKLLESVPLSLRKLAIYTEAIDLTKAWPKLTRLAHLAVRTPELTPGTIDLPNLTTVRFLGSHAELLSDARLPALVTLALVEDGRAGPITKLLDQLDAPSLARIELDRIPCGTEVARDLFGTRAGGRIRELVMIACGLSDADAKHWAKYPPPNRLALLDVRNNAELTKHGIALLRSIAERVLARDTE